MPSSDPIVFWQNTPSIHQAPLMRALARQTPARVVVITEFGLSPRRQQLGWHLPDYGAATLVVAPDQAERRRLEASLAGGVHVFSGLGAYPATTRSLLSVGGHGDTLVGVYAEPWDPAGWRGRLRPLRYRAAARRLRASVDFLLTTGPLGQQQYVRVGFPATRVFRFGYFVDVHDGMRGDAADTAGRDAVRLVFVGSVNPGKQPDLLLTALARLKWDWTLDVVGDGPLRERATALSGRLGIDRRIRWHGQVGNATARDIVGASDILVLPSRYDGWGAVVNEALLAGTRVVASDRCGAQDLVVADERSRVFPAGDVTSLTRALTASAGYGRVDDEERAARIRWATTHLAPERGAQYLLDVVAHLRDGAPRPVPPWAQATSVR
ncbi:glycosyltransferase family 4 protein [Micromonospora gifhornensis]|uniref:glycosyltransferase family 4 protein n=1 Tax=Micromonospora gifhornensis TaxID=84594 RepID=UPI003D7089B8